MTTCSRCNGLIAEPGKAYSYSGEFCHCGWANSTGPINPGPQQDMDQIREKQEASNKAKTKFLTALVERDEREYKETVKQVTAICNNLTPRQLKLLIDVLKALYECQAYEKKEK